MIKKKLVLAGLVASAALVAGCKKEAPKQDDSTKLATNEQKISYFIGQNVGKSLQQGDVNLDHDAFMLGINDAKAGTASRISEEELGKVTQEIQKKMMEKREAEQKKLSETNKAEGEKFLTENKAKEGVQVTASGLQYKVITAGNGVKPKATDTVKVNYVGKFVNGTEFDSSAKHGQAAEFPVNQVIPGWTEALQLMPQGSKWELYIPSDLAYGPQGNQGIPPASTLIFEVELLEVKAAPAAPAEEAKPAAKGKK